MGKSALYINAAAFTADGNGLEKYFEAKNLRRMDVFTKLAVKAAARCLRAAEMDLRAEKNIALIISTGYGPVTRTCDFFNSIIDDGEEYARPLAFSMTVHNAAVASVSRLLNIKGPCLSVSNMETSFQSALLAAAAWLRKGMADRVLLGAVDEIHSVAEKVLQTHPEEFAHIYDTMRQAGAAFFIVSLENSPGAVALPELSVHATPLNPSADAFHLAKHTELLLDYDDVGRIAADFIKTELARTGHDIMSVFESADGARLLHTASDGERARIQKELGFLFSGVQEEAVSESADWTASSFAKLKEHGLINFFTSGSTGEVKSCIHTLAMLREEGNGLAFLFPDIKRVISLVPASHSYGMIFGLIVPKILGLPVVIKPPIPVIQWEDVLQEGDLLVAFPMFLKQLTELNFQFPRGVAVLTSTAPCPDDLIDKLYAGGMRRLVEIYGASEGGAFGWREKSGHPFTLLPFWNAEITGGMLEAITRRQTPMRVRIPDRVEIDSEGKFKPIGRIDQAVQVAGINVFPQKVETILKTHPAVRDAAVRRMRPDEGERLKAFIVLQEGYIEHEILPGLRAFMKEKLTVHETPRRITFGSELPVTDFGKRRDW
ncbi:MAG: beta-ketoacyl synthase chain length factor [Spirochaetota bacterium]|jgi:4-coumarate--CoA ligase (photoactive yellow protein activation family)|nr:beta-ketoacyl synthase chain length factor [Spirochaetota bacterium]